MAANLEAILRVRDEASGTLDRVQQKSGGLGQTFRRLSVVGAAGLGALGAAALKFGSDFDNAFNTIAIGTGATGDALKDLESDFKEVFKRVPTDMETAASAIADLNTLTGATGESLQLMAENAIQASRLMGVDSKALIEDFGQTLNVFAIEPGKDAADILDRLFVVSQSTGIGIDTLTTQLQTFGPVLQNMGFNLIETAALFGQLNKAGIDLTRIMPGINAFSRRLAEEGVEDLRGAFEDVVAEIRDAVTVSDALARATEAFGAEGAQRLVTAIRSGALDVDEMVEGLRDADGAIIDAAREAETLGDKFTLLKNQVLVALEPALTGLFDGLLTAIDRLPDLAARVNDNFVVPVKGFVGGLIEDFGRLRDLFNLGAEGGIIGGDFSFGEEAAFEIGRIFRDDIKPAIDDARVSLDLFFASLQGSTFGGQFSDMQQKAIELGAAVRAMWQEDIQPALAGLQSITAEVAAFVVEHWETIRGAIGIAVDEMTARIEDLGRMFELAADFVRGLVQTVDALIHGEWDAAWDAFSDTVETTVEIVIFQAERMVRQVERAVERVRSLFEGLQPNIQPDEIFGIDIFPFAQHGGVIPGPMGAPRLVVAHGGENFGAIGSAGEPAGGGAGGVTIIMQGGTYNLGGRDLEDVLGDMGFGLQRELRARGIAS